MAKTATSKSEPQEISLTISTRSFVRLALMIIAAAALLMAIHKATHGILLVFSAFVLALALNAPVYWVSEHLPGKRRGSRALATSLSVLIVLALIGGFLASIVPPLVHQTENFINAAPSLVKDFRNQNSATGKLIRKYHLQNQVNTFSNQLSDRLKNIGGTAFSTLEKFGSSAFTSLTILALTFMMLVEGPRWVGLAREMIPNKRREMADRVTAEMYRVVKGYVNGQVILALIASAFILPALFILHISYPVALVVVVFVCGLIPMVGHTIGAVIVTTVALFHSPTHALIILAYYILYQQIENYLIQPRVQANSTNMSPLLVFMSVVIGVSFGGLFGGLVAIPAAGCLRIVVLEYLRSQNILQPVEIERAIAPTHKTR